MSVRVAFVLGLMSVGLALPGSARADSCPFPVDPGITPQMLFDGKRPSRASKPPVLRLDVRPGQVVAVDQPVGECSEEDEGVWWEDATVAVIDRRSRPALGHGVQAVGFAGVSTPSRQANGFVWPRTVVPVSQWESRIVRLRFARPGQYGILGGNSDVGWSSDGSVPAPANPPADLSGARYDPERDPYLVAVTVAGRPVPGSDIGGSLGGRAPVFLGTCTSTESPLLARAPSRKVRRAGRPRVRLRKRREVCTRQRIRNAAARQRARALPTVPGDVPGDDPPPLADCLITPDAVPLALNGYLRARRSWCALPAVIGMRVTVQVGNGPKRTVGTGRGLLARRIDWDTRSSNGRFEADLTYQGISGVIAPGAFFGFRLRCEFAFGARCAGVPRGDPVRGIITTGSAHVSFDIAPGALPGGSIDFLQPWLEISLGPTAGTVYKNPVFDDHPAVIGGPRARCDARGGGQGCVWADFDPTMSYRVSRTPEIAAHILAAQAAGQPGGRISQRPLTRTSNANRSANRREACPRSLVIRYRRERPGGSCDEYPFASTRQGGRGASTANVPEGEQRAQGGLVSGFYASERVLVGDNYWVGVSP